MNTTVQSAPHVFLVAGEESGDRLGAALIAALRRQFGETLRVAGVGGAQMTAQGVASLFPLGELAIIDVTCHAHIFGHPRGAYFYGKIVEAAAACKDVWIARRIDIANHVLAQER